GLALELLASAGELREGVQVLGEEGDDRLLFWDACEEAWFGHDASVEEAVRALAAYVSVDARLPGPLWEALSRAREDGQALLGAALLGSYDAAGLLARLW